MQLRTAAPEDAQPILRLINTNSKWVLPRTIDEIEPLIKAGTFWVVEDGGELAACCCLEIYTSKIAELRSLVVKEEFRKKGYGALLVEKATGEAKKRGVKEVMVVTSALEFFERMNFGSCLNEKYALFWRGT